MPRSPLTPQDKKALGVLRDTLADTRPAHIGLMYVPLALRLRAEQMTALETEERALAQEEIEVQEKLTELRGTHNIGHPYTPIAPRAPFVPIRADAPVVIGDAPVPVVPSPDAEPHVADTGDAPADDGEGGAWYD